MSKLVRIKPATAQKSSWYWLCTPALVVLSGTGFRLASYMEWYGNMGHI